MIYSSGRNTTIIHTCEHCVNTDVKGVTEYGNKLPMQKYDVLTLLAAELCCVMSRTRREYF